MRNRTLHGALQAFAEEAAWQLASDAADGHEVAFELIERTGRRGDAPLYCYRPLTAAFIDERTSILARLDAYLPAVHALSRCEGLEAYVAARVARGVPREPRARAELALRAFLSRVFEESTDFVLGEERFERAYAELEAVVTDGRTQVVVVAPLLGVAIESAEIEMGDGLSLVRGDVLDDGPIVADVLAVVRWDVGAGEPAPVDEARSRLRRLLTALRLYDDAFPSLGAAGWSRTATGPWSAFPLGVSGAAPRGTCWVPAVQEDELRAFCRLVARRTPHGGELAWALARFELGCDRVEPAQALTDHLWALRALLEPEGPAGGLLACRLAALCAEPFERAALAHRLAAIVALERPVVTGAGAPHAEALQALVDELAGYGRAVLRDLLCGHLDPDVRALADEIVAEAQPTMA